MLFFKVTMISVALPKELPKPMEKAVWPYDFSSRPFKSIKLSLHTGFLMARSNIIIDFSINFMK